MRSIHHPEHKIPDWNGIQSDGLVSKHNNFLPSVGGNISSGSEELQSGMKVLNLDSS